MIKLYNRELKYKTISNVLYEVLRNNKVSVEITDTIKDDDSIYIILGGEYILNPPKNYIIYQCLPTSHLTLRGNVEAYWIEKNYIELLKNSIYVLEHSKENVKVWEDYYKLSNVIFFDWSYQSSLLTKDYKESYTLNKNSNIFIWENQRGRLLYDKYKDKIKNLNTIINYDYYSLVDNLKDKKAFFILVSDYEQTYVDLPLIFLLRYNNIPCLIENGRDNYLNQKCQELGCFFENYIRLKNNLLSIINKNIGKLVNNNSKKVNNILDNNLLCFLEKNQITGKKTKKKFSLYNRKTIESVDFEILADGGISLKLGEISDEDLPNISVCTPTANRRNLFVIAIYNFLNFIYPKNKLEWVILDDGEETIRDLIPRDSRINYIYSDIKKDIGEKRNSLIELAKHETIVFMDDDDYYAPESLIARVKSLLKYKKLGVECVGCIDVATYNISNGECAITSNGKSYLCESSLAFTKKFWNERKFRDDKCGEFRYFLEYRQDKLRTIPFQYVTIAITHRNNTTGKVRAIHNKNEKSDKDKIYDMMGEEFLDLLNRINQS